MDAAYTALVYLIAGVLLVPFSLHHMIAERWLVAGVIGLTSVAFIVLARWIHTRNRAPLFLNALLAVVAIATGLIAIHQVGLVSVYWLFPLVGVSYLLFTLRLAAFVNLAFLALAMPVILLVADPGHLFRIVTTLFLTSCFAFLFAHNLERSKRELERLATVDPLTSAGNRRAMEQALDEAVYLRYRYGAPASLVVLDIDHFKRLNDDHGHPVGDAVLVELTELCRQRLRRSDRMFRYGGEEFVFLLRSTREYDAVTAAEQLRRQVEAAVFAAGHSLTVSLGVAELAPGESCQNWLRRADAALYEAKAAGRNRVAADESVPERPVAALS